MISQPGIAIAPKTPPLKQSLYALFESRAVTEYAVGGVRRPRCGRRGRFIREESDFAGLGLFDWFAVGAWPFPFVGPAPMSDAFEELAELWARRDRLDEAEWTRLYGLVSNALASRPPDEERSLSSSKEAARAWRDSFFTDKVLMPATAGNAAMSRELTPGGLPHFYRNYLRDQLRKMKRRPEYQGYEGAEDDLADEQTLGDELPAKDASDTGVGADDLPHCPSRPGDSADFDVDRIGERAAEFLAEAEDWVVIYLALHFCHGRDRLPLSKIHQQFQIPSYHYKARELGIAPPRGGYENFEDFGETMIGRWLAGCGVALDPERMETIRQAFDLLCLAAFREAGQRGLADFREESR